MIKSKKARKEKDNRAFLFLRCTRDSRRFFWLSRRERWNTKCERKQKKKKARVNKKEKQKVRKKGTKEKRHDKAWRRFLGARLIVIALNTIVILRVINKKWINQNMRLCYLVLKKKKKWKKCNKSQSCYQLDRFVYSSDLLLSTSSFVYIIIVRNLLWIHYTIMYYMCYTEHFKISLKHSRMKFDYRNYNNQIRNKSENIHRNSHSQVNLC